MSPDRLRKIVDEAKEDWILRVSRSSLSAQEIVELLDTQAYFELLKEPYPTGQSLVIKRLRRDKFIQEAGKGEFSIFNIGALLLAKRLSDFPTVSRKAVRIISLEGESKPNVKREITIDGGYASAFSRIVGGVMAQMPHSRSFENGIRSDESLLPEKMIREIMANALIHQDLEASGTSPIVEIYGDRVVISNPGAPGVSVERFIDDFHSRNGRLAEMMRSFGLCEEFGSGIDEVVKIAESHQLPAPDFLEGPQRTTAVLFGARRFRDMDKKDKIRACYQHCVLQYIVNEKMTNGSLRDRFGIPAKNSAIITRLISSTIRQKLIKADASATNFRRSARYIPHWA